MCGIGAVLDFSGPTSDAAGAAMLAALHHRGPDGQGVRRVGPLLLAHTRLAIIDVAGGRQPLESEDGSCLAVVNGEIYNHRELRAELEACGHRFATGSDCEVAVHGYEEWGDGFVRRLNGIFGLVVWDDRRQRLIAARDAFGVKPLYWWSDGRRLAIASEVRALLAAGLVTPELDRVAVDHFLAWRFVPSPRTIFEGVSRLPAASVLVAEEGRRSIECFRESPGQPLADASTDELEQELAAGLSRATTRQMMSDVPYGAFLSGGIDSAAVVAAMSVGGAGTVRTFTVGFPGHGEVLDEREAAAATAAALGAHHSSTAMSEFDFPAEVAASVERLEEPCGIPSAPAALQLSRFAAREVKVVLSGQGADEPLGGYRRHQAAALLRLAAALPPSAAGPSNAVARAFPRQERFRRATDVLATPKGLGRLLRIFEITTPASRVELTGRDGLEAEEERVALAREVLSDLPASRDPLEQALYLDTHLFLPDSLLLYGDKTSMAASLEQRVPFLDVEFMRFVERIPARLRVRGLSRKWLYRRAVKDLVPAAALARRKHPFSTPYESWLRSSLGGRVERLYSPGSELAEIIDSGSVSSLVGAHRQGRANHKRVLYCLLELATWHATFIARREPGEDAASA